MGYEELDEMIELELVKLVALVALVALVELDTLVELEVDPIEVVGLVAEVDVTGHTVVVIGIVLVVTWGVPGQLVTVGAHEVTVYSVVV